MGMIATPARFRIRMFIAASLGLALAGFVGVSEFAEAKTAVPTPTGTPTFAPTSTPSTTPTPTATPTVDPNSCTALWPQTAIVTIGKGQSPSNNDKLSHAITGHIVDPNSYGNTAHRIEICAGTWVNVEITDATGTPTNTADGSLSCNSTGCSGTIHATEKYGSTSQDGKDRDRITFLPK